MSSSSTHVVKLRLNTPHSATTLSGKTSLFSVPIRNLLPNHVATLTVRLKKKGGDPLLMLRAGLDPPSVPRRSKIVADAWDQEAFDAEPDTWALLTGQPELAGVHARDAVYLDTETTGLAGGVGTFVWMVGLGRFLADGGFEVWQGYLPGPEAEVPFLTAVAERIAAAGSIVSSQLAGSISCGGGGSASSSYSAGAQSTQAVSHLSSSWSSPRPMSCSGVAPSSAKRLWKCWPTELKKT